MKLAALRRFVRRYLMAGLLVWVPILATVLVVRFILDLMDETLLLLPPGLRPQALFGIRVPGFGALLAIVLLLLTGVLVSNIIGRSFMAMWDELLNRIPFVRAIYGGVKSFSTTILTGSGNSFKKVLLVEYPRKGLWTIAFQTAADVPLAPAQLGEPHVCVFVPTTPNPTAGFIVLLPRSQAIELRMSVDEAMKMIVTLGVVMPSASALEAAAGPVPLVPAPAPAPAPPPPLPAAAAEPPAGAAGAVVRAASAP